MVRRTALGGIDWDRVHAVAETLALVPVEALEVIELGDPQYRAIRLVAEKMGLRGLAFVVANALVSYRLTSRGEDYWVEFSERLTSEKPTSITGFFEKFLPTSRGNRLLARQKLSRLQRASRVLEGIIERPEEYADLRRLIRELAHVLGAKNYEKTIVFAAKMAYYFFKAVGVNVRGLEDIPVPIDSRFALVTATSGMVYDKPARIAARPEQALNAWREVSAKSGIPQIHLDALVWLPAAGLDRALRRGLEFAREHFARNLYSYLSRAISWEEAQRIAVELVNEYPPN